jgi:post-segregation antitoxin (ccd killing protein)
MRLLNVRLDEEDAKLVRSLRERGISISHVVRRAIRAEAGRHASTADLDVDALLAEMARRYPLPGGAPGGRRGSTADRRQVQKIIRAKLRRRS